MKTALILAVNLLLSAAAVAEAPKGKNPVKPVSKPAGAVKSDTKSPAEKLQAKQKAIQRQQKQNEATSNVEKSKRDVATGMAGNLR